MRRFVVIATANRGKVSPPEPLSAEDEALVIAGEGWQDAHRLYRESVVWNDLFSGEVGRLPVARESRTERMMRLAKMA